MVSRLGLLFGILFISPFASAEIPTVHCGLTTNGSIGGVPRFQDSIKFEEGIENYLVSIDQRLVPGSFMEKLTKKQADYQFYQLRLEFVKVRDNLNHPQPACTFNSKNTFLVSCPYIPKLAKAHLTQIPDPANAGFPTPGIPVPPPGTPQPELVDKDLDIQQMSLSTQRVTRESLSGENIQKEELLRLVVMIAGPEFPFPNQLQGEINHAITTCGVGELPTAPAN